MRLYIDTSNTEKIVVGIDDKRFKTDAKKEKAQKLLSFIDEILKMKGKSIQDVTEIKVNTGPGSFTGLRVGLAVANTIGWALGIPVNGKDIAKVGSVEATYS